MSEATAAAAFAGPVPELYDRILGPMLFEPFARDLAARFTGFEGRLLETAAGTGRLTRVLAEAVEPSASITATDLNAPMLAQAAASVIAGNVAFKTADAQRLPFEDESFEAVACQFGAMFFPDKVAAFREARRVLGPKGRFVFSVWDALEANDVSQIVHDAVAARFPDDPPDFFARIPFGFHDTGQLGEQVLRGGFSAAHFDWVQLPTPAPSAAQAAAGLCLGTPLRAELEARAPDRLDETVQAVQAALEATFGPGPLIGTGRAIVVTAEA